MLQSFWLFLVSLCWAGTAAAAPEAAIAFRAEAAAAGEYILLKDVVELPADMAQACGQSLVWTAPPPGQVYTLTRDFLQYRLTQLGLEDLLARAAIPPAIQVRQTGTYLTKEQVDAAFRRYLLTHSPWPARQVRLEIMPLEEPVLWSEDMTLEVLPPKNSRLAGEVTLEMGLMKQGQLHRRFKVRGRVIWEREVVCAARPLAPRTVIGPDDISLYRRDVTGLGPEEYFVSPEQVLGRVLSRGLGPQEILTLRHLSHEPLIHRGEEVTVILEDNQGLAITTKAVAREPGYPGRPIRMLNPKSKKEFQALVVDARTVKVTL